MRSETPERRDEKLQKVLARAGLGSRRELEAWIAAGRVTVDGRPATLGDRVHGREHICVDGRRIMAPSRRAAAPRVLRYHKPPGEICTRADPGDRPTVFERLPPLAAGRWIAVGRLDLSTSGLLLFTDSGELAHRLMHPSTGLEREYMVRVLGEVDPGALRRLREGVVLDDGPARFQNIVGAGGDGANRWYRVTLREGRSREVRRLWESQGLAVSRLVRIRYGPLTLPRRIRPGRWEEVAPAEVVGLLKSAGLRTEAESAKPKPAGPGGRRTAANAPKKKPIRRGAVTHGRIQSRK